MDATTTPLSQRQIYAVMLAGITMMAALLWMPSMLGAIGQGYGMSPAALSRLAFAELIGFLLGTLFTSNHAIWKLRRWALIGCVLIAGANLWSLLSADRPPALALRLIAGAGAGVGFGYGLRACAASARPTRSFGIFTASMSLVMIIGFQTIAHLIQARAAIDGSVETEVARDVVSWVLGAYAGAAVAAALIHWFTRPAPAGAAPVRERAAPRLPGPLVLTCLLAIAIAFVGQGSVWAFMQLLGISHGFEVGGVANAMSGFAIAGIAGSLASAATPTAWRRSAAIGVALIVLWAGLYALYAPRSFAWFAAGCAVGGFYWNFVLPLMLGLLARIDVTGQGAVLGGTMSSIGSALGPLAAGQLVEHMGYRPVGWMTGSLCLASLVLVWMVERRAAPAYAGVPTVAT